MRSAIVAIGLALMGLLGLIEPSLAARRVALVVGNANYQNAPGLPKSTHNADAMAEMFRQARFDVVITLSDANLAQFNDAVARFRSEASNSDVAVVYFTGYGIDIDNIDYLMPIDAKLEKTGDAQAQAVTLESLADAAGGAKRLRLIIADALHGDPFPAGKAESDPGLDVPAPQAGTLIAYPAMAGTEAQDGNRDISIYTSALLQNLFAPGLDIRLAFGRVLDAVLRNTGRQQSSFVYGSLGGGNISLVSALPDRPMLDLAGEKTDYRVVEQINTAHAWEVFMVQHPSGFYFASAREKLRLAEAEPGEPAQPSAAPRRPQTASREEGLTPETPPPANTEFANPALISLAQQELARIGCYSGSTTGAMDQATRDAIRHYQNAQGQNPSLETPITRNFVAELQKQTVRVCPLLCPAGEVAQGNQCVEAGGGAPSGRGKQPAASAPTTAKRPPRTPPATASAPPPRAPAQASSGARVMPGVGF
jgi:hypothetical protein